MKKKVLFIGGTGCISSEMAKECIKNGWEVTIFTRGSQWRKCLVSDNSRLIYGDLRNVDELHKAVEGQIYDVIIDFNSFVPENLRHKLIAFDSSFKQYIFVSSVAAYNAGRGETVTEDNTPIGSVDNVYGWNKSLCECYLKEYFKFREESYTIIRPGYIYGDLGVPYPLTENWMQGGIALLNRIENRGVIPVFYDDDYKCRILHARDFAKIAICLLGNEAAYNDTFHIVSEDLIAWNRLLELIGYYMNVPINLRHITMEKLIELVPEWEQTAKLGLIDWNIDNTKIRKIKTDISFGENYNSGIKNLIEFYKKNSETLTEHEEIIRVICEMNYKLELLCRL